jgi:hypothetical protein
MQLPGKTREIFAKIHARNTRGDRAEGTPDFRWSVRLHIPHIQMAWPAIQEDHNAGFRAGCTALFLAGQQLRQGQSYSPQCADAQEFAAAEASARTAKSLCI